MLGRYIAEVQDHLNDSQGQFFPESRLARFINVSRRRVASISGCLRCIPDGIQTQKNQEIYQFSDWKAQAQDTIPGTSGVLAVRSLAIALGGAGAWKPMWRRLPFSDFQARFRIFNGTFWGVNYEAGWYAQLGLGEGGKLYLAPIPSMALPMDIDMTLIPEPLLTDDDPEPIPYPWTDAVSYWAACLALLSQQRKEDAAAMAQMFNSDMPMAASIVCPQMLVNPYGVTLRSA